MKHVLSETLPRLRHNFSRYHDLQLGIRIKYATERGFQKTSAVLQKLKVYSSFFDVFIYILYTDHSVMLFQTYT